MHAVCISMDGRLDLDGLARLKTYFDTIGSHLSTQGRASFATYAMGIFGDGERKSVEPMAARFACDPSSTQREHDRLLYFLRVMPWSDTDVRREAAKMGIDAMQSRGPISSWILDDTGFLKQGRHSVGVQRQYTGSAGKIANCQLAVSLTVANQFDQLPIDMELYLPQSWADGPMLRKKAQIPKEISFRTKHEIAMDMVDRALEQGVPRGVLLMDAWYGTHTKLRKHLSESGLQYAVGVNSNTPLFLVDKRRIGTTCTTAETYAKALDRKKFRRICWRDGTGARLESFFHITRVGVDYGSDDEPDLRQEWLIVEWPKDELRPSKYALSTLPVGLSKKRIVATLQERWRTERAYEDLKGELGLDHFEGRSFPGWNHHVSVVLCCYAFVVAERIRAFPPSKTWSSYPAALSSAA